MKLSSILTGLMAAIVLLAIPLTVLMLNRQQGQATQASNIGSFSVPPVVSMTVSNDLLSPNNKIISVNSENSNWYTVYFAENIPSINVFNSKRALDDSVIGGQLLKIYEASENKEFSFIPPKNGKLFVMSYQLGNYSGNFQSGDVVCSWDGHLYIYERQRPNLIDEVLNKEQERPGVWQNFASCENSGVIDITLAQ